MIHTIIICFLSFILAACSGSGGHSFQDNTDTGDETEDVKTSAELLSVSADGAASPAFAPTTTITLVFDQFITGLTTEEITIAAASGTVIKDSLTKTAVTGQYTLSVETLSLTGVGNKTIEAAVTVSGVAGYEIDGEKGATLYANIAAIPDRTTFAKIGSDDPAYPLSGSYKQTADIDFRGVTRWRSIATAISDTDTVNSFSGTFDGGGYSIINVNLTGLTAAFSIFGMANGGTFKNIHVAAGTMKFASDSVTNFLGVLTLNARNSTFINCSNAANLTSSAYVGGICTIFNGGQIINCFNTGSINSAAGAGGIVSTVNAGSTVSGCYNTGAITAGGRAGGIVGSLNDGAIIGCYNTGSVTAATGANCYAGGIAGLHSSSSSAGLAKITACYNTGAVSSTVSSPAQAFIGGISGSNVGLTKITACYNLGDISAAGGTYMFLGGISGASKLFTSSQCVITDCYWKDGAGPAHGLGYRAVNSNYTGTGAYDGTGNGGWDDAGMEKFASDKWPGESGEWGAGGIYWKNLGSWNGGTPIYPKLWFET
jgi:hypothetical protein